MVVYGGLFYGIPQDVGVILIFPNHVTIVFSFRTFQETVEMAHSGSIYLLQFMAELSLCHSLLSLCLHLFAAKISLFMNPLLTCCGVLSSCIVACLSSKFLRL